MELLSYVNKLKNFTISDVLVTPSILNLQSLSEPNRNRNIYNEDYRGQLIVDDRDYFEIGTPTISLPTAVDLTELNTVLREDRSQLMTAISTPLRTAPALSDRMIQEVRQAVQDAIRDVIRGGNLVTDANVEGRTIHATIQLPAVLERIETTISFTPDSDD